MRVRFKRAVREGICFAEKGMEWDAGEDEARFLIAPAKTRPASSSPDKLEAQVLATERRGGPSGGVAPGL
jgi:hypothetical protein